MAINREEIQYIWKGDNKSAINALAELESKYRDNNITIKQNRQQLELLRLDGKKNTAEYKALAIENNNLSKAQKQNALAINEQRSTMGLAGQSTAQLKRHYKELSKELEMLTVDSEAFNKSLANKLSVQKELDRRKAATNPTQSLLEQMKGQMPSALAGGLAGGMVGISMSVISGIGSALGAIIPPMKSLADENSNLKIALNLTDAEFQKMDKSIRGIKTRTLVSDLKEIGLVAGDLNVPTEQVAEFVKETDKGALVFKRSFASAEEYATSIGKLKGMFKEFKDQSYGESINDIGSAMKVLEDDGPATAKGILEFTTRIGQLPESLRPAIAETMAYAAVFEEAGLTAEISSGGVSNVLLVASKNAKEFAKFLGMTTEEFKQLLNNNPNEMLIRLAQSFNGLSNTQIGQVMKGLKIDSQESVKVLGTLADNTDKLAAKQALSNQALADGSRITEIFNEKNNNFAGSVEKINKRLGEFTHFLTSPFRNTIEDVTLAFGRLIGAFDEFESHSDKFSKLNNQLKNYNNNLLPLISKYEELKLKNPEKSQAELHKIMNEIVSVMPLATSKVDSYGRTIEINTNRVKDYIVELKNQNKELGIAAQQEQANKTTTIKKQLDLEQKKLQKAISSGKRVESFEITNRGDIIEGVGVTITEQTKKVQTLAAEYQTNFNKLVDVMKTVRGISTKATPATPPPKTSFANVDFGGGSSNSKKSETDAKKALNDKLKRIEDEAQQSLDLQIELQQKADMRLATEEQKKILALEQSAESKINKLKTQFKNEHGLILDESQWTASQKNIYSLNVQNIEQELQDKVLEIGKQTAEKRAKQLLDEQAKGIELARQAALSIAQARLDDAQKGGSDLEQYNAHFSLLSLQEQQEQAKLTESYEKKKTDLAGNNEALLQLDENYYLESNAIAAKYTTQQSNLSTELYKKQEEQKQKANLESLKLDVESAKGKGIGEQQTAKIALLNAEMTQELSVKNLTEQEKTNIQRKYAMQRHQLEIEGFQQVAGKVIDYMQQAYSSWSTFQANKVQAEVMQEDESNKKKLENLDTQKNKGIISAEQYNAKKTALEAAHDKKTRALQRKQAELNKQNQIMQATMGMAKSIIEVSGTPWMIPIVAVLGLAQIAAISSTPLPAYAMGGFTNNQQSMAKGKPSATAQLAWVNEQGTEYIVPNHLLQRPAIANMVQIIEAARSGRGYATGGYTSDATANIPSFSTANITQAPVQVNLPNSLVEAIQQVAKMQQEGVKVYFSGADYRKFHEDYTDYQQSQKDSGL